MWTAPSTPSGTLKPSTYELILSDIDILDRRIDRAVKALKGDKKYQTEVDMLQRLKAYLETGASARGFECESDAEREIFADIPLLSAKPVIYAANMSEAEFTEGIEGNPYLAQVQEIAAAEGAEVVPICAQSGRGDHRHDQGGQAHVPGGTGSA